MATTNYSWNLPTVGGSEDTWGTQLNANWTALDTLLGGVNATEFEILDGLTATTSQLNSAATSFVPSGGIIMWSGVIADIPSGWLLCDGTSGTPDLRDKFLVGAGGSYVVGGQGGSADAVVVSHTHTATVTDPGHSHTIPFGLNASGLPGGSLGAQAPGSSTSTATTGISVGISTTGSSGVNANLPPYYALAYIMKA
jgi:hypothetical protein